LLTILFLSMIILLILGMDIGFVMLTSSIVVVGLSYVTGDFAIPFEVIPQYLFGGVDSFSFTAIPLFILAGEIMNRGGITDKLVEFSQKMVGHIRGGVAQTGVAINVVMAGISGSAVADCTATGSILIPAMKKDGYSLERSSAIIASASTIGPVFPPSIPMVIIGSLAGLSVGKLFLAGIVPGLLMGIALMIYIYLYAKRTNMPRHRKSTFQERMAATKSASLALLMPIIIIGSIMSGIVTPTECAVLAVLYALGVAGLHYKSIRLHDLKEIFVNAAISTGSIMIIAAGGVLFGWLATYYNLGDVVQDFLLSISSSPIVILIIINVLLLLLGMVLEAIPIILLVVPILYPMLTNLGIDPIHFSMIVIVNLMIGLITPPVGLHLFITSSIAKVPITAVIKESFPFMMVLLIVLALVTFVPAISTFIPNLLMP
jgi:C4-dicarboxylate transporter DctM subunit